MKHLFLIIFYCFGLGTGIYIDNVYNKKAQEPIVFYASKPRKIELYISSDKKKIIVLSAEVEGDKVLKGTMIQSIWHIEPMSSLKIFDESDSHWYKFQLDKGYLRQIGKEVVANSDSY